MLKAAPASTCRSRKTAGWWTGKGMRWNWTTNDRWAGHLAFPPIGLEPLPTGSRYRTGFALGRGSHAPRPQVAQCRRRDCCPRDRERLRGMGHHHRNRATGYRLHWHKAAITQKVLPLKVGRGAQTAKTTIGDVGSGRATAENKKPPSVSGPMTASEYAHTSKRSTLSEFR